MVTFIAEFDNWMNDQITVQKTTRNNYGERVVVSSQVFTGHIRYVDRIVRGNNGEEKLINHIVYIPNNPGITLDDIFVLPDEGTREIVTIQRLEDEDGSISYVRVMM